MMFAWTLAVTRRPGLGAQEGVVDAGAPSLPLACLAAANTRLAMWAMRFSGFSAFPTLCRQPGLRTEVIAGGGGGGGGR